MQGLRIDRYSPQCHNEEHKKRSTIAGKIWMQVVFLEEVSLPQGLHWMLGTLECVDDG